jgi:hypothetical protein
MTPEMGPVGTGVTITFTEMGENMWGGYEFLWSSSAAFMSEQVQVLKNGTIPDGSTSYILRFNIPEAPYGTYYMKFKCLESSTFMNFQISVKQNVQLNATSFRVGDTIRLSGTGFTASDDLYIRLNQVTMASSVHTSPSGSFSHEFMVPALEKGEYRLSVGSQTMAVYETHVIEILPAINQVDIGQPDGENINTPAPSPAPVNTEPVYYPPSSPVPLSPSGSAIGLFGDQPVIFGWSEPSHSSAISYMLEISNDPGFALSSAPERHQVYGKSSYTVWLRPGTYYWRIMAVDSRGGQSDWYASPYAFKVSEGSIFLADLLDFFRKYSIFTILALVIAAFVLWSIISAILHFFEGKRPPSGE